MLNHTTTIPGCRRLLNARWKIAATLGPAADWKNPTWNCAEKWPIYHFVQSNNYLL